MAGAVVSIGLCVFSGKVSAGFADTFPLINSSTGLLTALEITVTFLLIVPKREVLYFTLITSDFPGMMGSLGQLGTVHPQEE